MSDRSEIDHVHEWRDTGFATVEECAVEGCRILRSGGEVMDPTDTRQRLIDSYEAKVQDLAAETRRATAWRDACRWAVAALDRPDRQTILDGKPWAPPDVVSLLAEAIEAGRPAAPLRTTQGADIGSSKAPGVGE